MVEPHSAVCSVLSVGQGAKGPLGLDVDEHHIPARKEYNLKAVNVFPKRYSQMKACFSVLPFARKR